MAVGVQGVAGPAIVADGASGNARLGRNSDLIVTELNARFYEDNFRGNIFSGGMGLTAINNVTFTSATLGATCTPIAGVWNPAGSGVNLIALQALLALTPTALTNTGGGPFVWAIGFTSAALTAALASYSRLTLTKTPGGKGQNLAGVALTGLSANLVVQGASALNGGSAAYSQVGTAAGFAPMTHGSAIESLDGSFIIPPGGVLALLATTTPVAHSAVSNLVWAEKQIS